MQGIARSCSFAVAALVTFAAAADDWQGYGNARFGYSIEIPPGFSAVQEADNSDGGTSQSEDGLAQLAVWGSNLLDGSLADEFDERIRMAEADGWKITYRRETPRWASWSGSDDGRVFYARAITLCEDQLAFFLIEYPRARTKSFDPIVKRLVASLKNQRPC